MLAMNISANIFLKCFKRCVLVQKKTLLGLGKYHVLAYLTVAADVAGNHPDVSGFSADVVSRPVAVSGDFATIVRHPDQKKKHIVAKKSCRKRKNSHVTTCTSCRFPSLQEYEACLRNNDDTVEDKNTAKK